MVKTYPEFIDVINSKIALYAQIPEEHLSIEGTSVYALYKTVKFNICFASNASELLVLLNEDEHVEFHANYVGTEYRSIRRCLERLAAAETAPTT